jgi:hypothetical protein
MARLSHVLRSSSPLPLPGLLGRTVLLWCQTEQPDVHRSRGRCPPLEGTVLL